jgi:hypothetical protein
MAFLLMPALDAGTAERFAELALSCVHREYPNKIAHVLNGDGDVRPPRELTPAFYGCYDWHSSVHGHWLLARLARLFPEAAFAERARAALAKSLTEENLRREVAYFNGTGRATFERPYGLAWLLTLAQELREMGSPHAAAVAPLEAGGGGAVDGLAAEVVASGAERGAQPDGVRVGAGAGLCAGGGGPGAGTVIG